MDKINKIEILNKINILKSYLIAGNFDNNEIEMLMEEVLKVDSIEFENIVKEIKNKKNNEAINLIIQYQLYLTNLIFKKPCGRKWEDLILTDTENIKFCLDCNKNVFLVSNKREFVKRKNLQQCVAFSPSVFTPSIYDERNFKSCRIQFDDFELIGNIDSD